MIRFSLAVEFFPSPAPRSTQSLSYPLLSVALPPEHRDVGSRTQPSGALSFPVRPWLTQNAIKLVPVYRQWSCHTLSIVRTPASSTPVAIIILTIDFVQRVTLSSSLVNAPLKTFLSHPLLSLFLTFFLLLLLLLPLFLSFFLLPFATKDFGRRDTVENMWADNGSRTLISDRGYFYRWTIFA